MALVAAVAALPQQQQQQQPQLQRHRYGDCLLLPTRARPKALAAFLGGAFIGASPELTYSYLLKLLSRQGIVVLTTPYSVTFDHETCAQGIHRKWSTALDLLASSGCPSMGITPQLVASLPRISIGHSNGALMQALIGSCFDDDKLPQANVIMSFNNKPASQAVPFFDQLGPVMSQASSSASGGCSSSLADMARNLTDEAMKLLETPFPSPLAIDEQTRESTRSFLQQIPGVFGQVADGVSEFRPTPEQNRSTISTSYKVPHNLLVKFSSDAIDETDALEALLEPQVGKMGGTLTKLQLSGTHLTPLATDIELQVGTVYTPLDALSQAVRKAALSDLNDLSRRICSWVDGLKADSLL